MKRHGLYTTAISLISSLMFIACSDDGDSSVNFVPTLTSTSSSSLISSSSDVAYSENDNPVSSSTNDVSSSSVETASSSSESAISSSAGIDQPTFSKYISQFAAPGESSVSFDSHVLAINAYGFSSKCADVMVRLDVEDDMIFLNSISEENIAECFPKTAPLLKNKFSSDVKFYTVLVQVGADPLFVILNKLTNDEISFVEVHPGGDGCILSTWVIETIFLIADTDGIIKDGKMPPYTGKLFRSEIWKCEDEGRRIPSVKNLGEWYNDSLL
ncbi:MAG: hypothetical protein J6P15_04435 [Fibrobacter sp.]|nr:hypothetical protein [Fibrobacter sp.]